MGAYVLLRLRAALQAHPLPNLQETAVPLDKRSLSVQIIYTLADLARGQKMQYGAFFASVGISVVWDGYFDGVIETQGC